MSDFFGDFLGSIERAGEPGALFSGKGGEGEERDLEKYPITVGELFKGVKVFFINARKDRVYMYFDKIVDGQALFWESERETIYPLETRSYHPEVYRVNISTICKIPNLEFFLKAARRNLTAEEYIVAEHYAFFEIDAKYVYSESSSVPESIDHLSYWHGMDEDWHEDVRLQKNTIIYEVYAYSDLEDFAQYEYKVVDGKLQVRAIGYIYINYEEKSLAPKKTKYEFIKKGEVDEDEIVKYLNKRMQLAKKDGLEYKKDKEYGEFDKVLIERIKNLLEWHEFKADKKKYGKYRYSGLAKKWIMRRI